MSSQKIKELESFFHSIELPVEPIKLDCCTIIFDIKLFLNSHFMTVYSAKTKQAAQPYLDRIVLLKELLTNK